MSLNYRSSSNSSVLNTKRDLNSFNNSYYNSTDPILNNNSNNNNNHHTNDDSDNDNYVDLLSSHNTDHSISDPRIVEEMTTTNESDPLLTPSRTTGKYYFLNKQESYKGGTTAAVRDDDGGVVVEGIPQGTTEDEFAPRIIGHRKHPSMVLRQSTNTGSVNENASKSTFWSKLFSSGGGGVTGVNNTNNSKRGDVGTLVKMRKAPVKIEPKVFFANERTFLAWMHLSIILAGASIAILAFTGVDENNNASTTNPLGQLYGIILLPVSIAFILYSMYQYIRRAKMIRHRHPGPYEDTVGPVVLGIMLMISIIAQFALKLYTMSQN